ncbi:MAG: lysophospholipid acyltransferase family protein [Pseudomonadota bacterium]
MRNLAFNLFFYVYTFFIALALYLAAKLSTQARMQRIIRHWGRTVIAAVRLILGSHIEVLDKHKVPQEGAVLLVSKHQSELDIVVLAAEFPQAAAVAMAELTRYPFFGPILRALDVVTVALEAGPQGRTEQVIEGTARVFGQDRPMMIYPEGELMYPGARERYRRGAAHLYTRLDPVVVPVANSLGVIWPRREWNKRSHRRGAVRFLDPIQPGLGFEAFLTEIETRIEAESMALLDGALPPEEMALAQERHAKRLNNKGEPVTPTEDA